MNVRKLLFDILAKPLRKGLFYRMRSNLQTRPRLGELLASPEARLRPLTTDDRVCIVGTGIAALTFARTLKLYGHTNVTIVARDDAFGGKCVNFGCMPAEYFARHRESGALAPADLAAKGAKSIAALRALAAESFKTLSFPIVKAEVRAVEGQTLHLADGQRLAFDRLVLATGNRADPPAALAAVLGETAAPESFWQLAAAELRGHSYNGLLLVTTNNPAILSYADMALDRGMTVTVLFESEPPLAHLPSFQFYQREIVKRGARVVFGATALSRSGTTLTAKTKSGTESFSFDDILFFGRPTPNIPKIDGRSIAAADIDFATASLPDRPDISLTGDAAGLLSAAEAELHARRLVEVWAGGPAPRDKIDAREFDLIPYRLHGRKTLAMVGAPWTFLKRDWNAAEFKQLGWSFLHAEEGKAWYLYDKATGRVEALHLCHRDAGELVNLAALLVKVPVGDSRWRTSFVHPSSAEIFKLIAEDIEARHGVRRAIPAREAIAATAPARTIDATTLAEPLVFDMTMTMPPAVEVGRAPFFDERFTEQERLLGVLDPSPPLYFGLLHGLKALQAKRGGPGATKAALLKRTDDDRYVSEVFTDLRYDADSKSISIYAAGETAKVTFTPMAAPHP